MTIGYQYLIDRFLSKLFINFYSSLAQIAFPNLPSISENINNLYALVHPKMVNTVVHINFVLAIKIVIVLEIFAFIGLREISLLYL